jgi:hypothetical protein
VLHSDHRALHCPDWQFTEDGTLQQQQQQQQQQQLVMA